MVPSSIAILTANCVVLFIAAPWAKLTLILFASYSAYLLHVAKTTLGANPIFVVMVSIAVLIVKLEASAFVKSEPPNATKLTQ